MGKSNTWIVVANSAQARLFKLIKFPQIEELSALVHPESRLHDQDLVSDRPGSTFDRGGTRRSSYEPQTDPKHAEVEKFAKYLGEYLSSGHQKGDFSRLYVMAAPAFLGMLRPHLTTNTQAAVVAEIAKDMTVREKADIEHQLAQL